LPDLHLLNIAEDIATILINEHFDEIAGILASNNPESYDLLNKEISKHFDNYSSIEESIFEKLSC
jgi:hypothetical protein